MGAGAVPRRSVCAAIGPRPSRGAHPTTTRPFHHPIMSLRRMRPAQTGQNSPPDQANPRCRGSRGRLESWPPAPSHRGSPGGRPPPPESPAGNAVEPAPGVEGLAARKPRRASGLPEHLAEARPHFMRVRPTRLQNHVARFHVRGAGPEPLGVFLSVGLATPGQCRLVSGVHFCR